MTKPTHDTIGNLRAGVFGEAINRAINGEPEISAVFMQEGLFTRKPEQGGN